MTFLRQLSTALSRIADHQQGQEVERAAASRAESRRGADYAAIQSSHSTAGVHPISFGL